MRACLAKFTLVAALLLALTSALPAQEPFPGTSYITPFPAGDTYRAQVYGDAFAEGLLGGLIDALGDDARVQLQRRRRPLAGITRPELDDELRTEEASKDTVHIAVVMVGYNDRWNIRTSPREFMLLGSPGWRAEYGRRVDRLAKTLKRRGTAIYWVGLPIMRRPELNDVAQVINDVVREKAYLNGIKYIDISAHFADEAGNYAAYGPDIAGKQRLVRDREGVLFTGAGYRKLAHFVEREIKRDLAQALSERAIPLAGNEAEQKRIAALRPRPPQDPAAKPAAAKEVTARDAGKAPPKAGAAGAPAAPADASLETKADHGRITLRAVGAGGREETVILELPRPPIPAAVLQLITRRDAGDRHSQMGDVLADDVGGGLVVLSSVTPVSGPGVPRRAAPGQPYYQVWFKGERLPPRPGRSDDFAWPRVEPDVPLGPPGKASPRS